jgi:hypothetical protein
MKKHVEKSALYYEEVLRNLSELLVVLKDNNIMLRELVNTMREDHQINLGIHDNVRKLRFNTQ